jgi:hypothetical protein
MEHDDRPERRPRSSKAEPTPAPTEAELSRFAREAVRQPADPRLDRELARMGLTETSDPAEPHTGPRGRPALIGPELERVRAELRRIQLILWILGAVTGILAVVVVFLLIR